jgi:hypothetical protein
MSTGYSPIGLALRDVGQGLGNVLTDEAQRRRDALAQQQEQNRFSLSQAALANQAQVKAAEGQVNLAEVATKGRQFDITSQLRERELTQQQEQQRGQLEVQRGQLDVNRAAQKALAEHQQALQDIESDKADTEERRAAAAERAAIAQQQESAARVRLYDSQRTDAEEKRKLGAQPVYLEDLFQSMDTQLKAKYGEDEGAKRSLSYRAAITSQFGDIHNRPVDPTTGKHYITQSQLDDAQKVLKPIYDSLSASDKAQLTPQEIAANLRDRYARYSAEFRDANPFDKWLPGAWALEVNPEGYKKMLAEQEGYLGKRRLALETQFAKEEGLTDYPRVENGVYVGGPPTTDTKSPLYQRYLNKVQTPLNDLRADWLRRGSLDLLTASGTNLLHVQQTAPPPAATKTPPATTAPPPPAAAEAPPPGETAPAPVSLAAAAQQRAQAYQESQRSLGGLIGLNEQGGALTGLRPGFQAPPAAVTQSVQALAGQPDFRDAPAFRRASVARQILGNTTLPDGVHVVPLDNGEVWRVSVVRGKVGDISPVGGLQATAPAMPSATTPYDARGTQPAGGQ